MATGGGDEGGIFWGESTQDAGGGPSSSSVNRVKYREFIRNFRLDEEYVYREALRSAIVTRQQMMEVDIDHLMEFDEELTNELLSKPGVHLPVFEKAALEAAVSVAIVEEGDEDVHLQTWKLQEAPESVPTGEMPRSIMMTVDRKLVDCASPGKRVLVTAIMSVMTQAPGRGGKPGGLAVRTPYLQVLGIQHGFEQRSQEGQSLSHFTPAEEELFTGMSREPDIYGQLCRSVAPSIFGSENVKKALACLLFGGARKELPDGARLRGDINVLLLGDPSVAKSQFLKFIEKAAPVAVYTSGKGSSAAGLTATVTQDSSSREFYLEGGAMVLADGGVVCIDEFDKMREQDRVAIHEAMEQQTISIAKAGITTVLNSRTSVLAAANPTFGRYQDEKNAAEQVDFQSTILSRFDMIFILRDTFEKDKDQTLARHILNVHMKGGASADTEAPAADIEINVLKRYVAYARAKCSPRLSEAAVARLESFYVKIRQEVQVATNEAEQAGRAPRAVPITVRQLEAIIRIAESCAKMRLSEVATEDDVGTAIELFNVSTLQAARMGDIELEGGGDGSEHSCEVQISQRVAIGSTVSRKTIVGDLNAIGLDQAAVNRAINALVRRGDYQEVQQGRKLRRVK